MTSATKQKMTGKFYSVSFATCPDDDGACLTFTDRASAEKARADLIADGCWHVSAVWVS